MAAKDTGHRLGSRRPSRKGTVVTRPVGGRQAVTESVVVWLGFDGNNNLVQVQNAERQAIPYPEVHSYDIGLRQVASCGSGECEFCWVSAGRIKCICFPCTG